MAEDYTPEHRAGDDYEDGDVVGRLNPMVSNSMYDRLKFVALVLLPAVGTFYFTVAAVWGLPAAEQVVGTIVAFDTLLGVFLGLSSASYKKETEGATVGFIEVEQTEEGMKAGLRFPGDPHDIVNHDKVTFKVRKR